MSIMTVKNEGLENESGTSGNIDLEIASIIPLRCLYISTFWLETLKLH